jgi:flagellar protein FliO/FliZ
MVLILAFVIGLVVGLLWLVKRFSGQSNRPDGPIKVLYTHVLSGSRTLYLVEIGNQLLLLGAGDAGVSLIQTLTDQETIDALKLASSRTSSLRSKLDFGTLVGQLLGKKPSGASSVEETVDQTSEFLKKQRERLKNLSS